MQRLRRPSPQMMAVLFALGERAAQQTHGYDLCRALDLRAGTLYPILKRLDERGLVDTEWEQNPPQGRPARHLYRLSSAGAEFVAGLRDQAGQAGRAASTSPRRPALGTTG